MAENVMDEELDDIDDVADDEGPVDRKVIKAPSREALNDLARQYARLKDEAAASGSDLGNLMKKAKADHGVHLGAFKLAMQLQKKSETTVAEFLFHFDHMRDVFGLDAQEDMLRASGADNVTPMIPKAAAE